MIPEFKSHELIRNRVAFSFSSNVSVRVHKWRRCLQNFIIYAGRDYIYYDAVSIDSTRTRREESFSIRRMNCSSVTLYSCENQRLGDVYFRPIDSAAITRAHRMLPVRTTRGNAGRRKNLSLQRLYLVFMLNQKQTTRANRIRSRWKRKSSSPYYIYTGYGRVLIAFRTLSFFFLLPSVCVYFTQHRALFFVFSAQSRYNRTTVFFARFNETNKTNPRGTITLPSVFLPFESARDY